MTQHTGRLSGSLIFREGERPAGPREERRGQQWNMDPPWARSDCRIRQFSSACFPLSLADLPIPLNLLTLGKRLQGGAAKEIKTQGKAERHERSDRAADSFPLKPYLSLEEFRRFLQTQGCGSSGLWLSSCCSAQWNRGESARGTRGEGTHRGSNLSLDI